MGRQGRYGKYGEHKRIERLRRGRGPVSGSSGGKGASRNGGRRPGQKGTATPAGLSLRPARPSDAGHVHFMSRVFDTYGPYREILREWLESGMAIAFIGLRNNRPAGFAMMGRLSSARAFPRVIELLAIAVEPSSRRLGLAGLMLEKVEDKAAALGAEKLVLHTGVDNTAARTLFQKHGFHVLDARGAFYPEGQDALTMIKEL